jgi:ATP-dependent DNA helicase RecQ
MIFKCERLQENNLYISPKRYIQRKEQMKKRVEAMIGYATQSAICRSRYMIEYFSQPVTRDCGVCDICLKKKKVPSQKTIENTIAEAIGKSKDKRLSFLEFKKLAGPQNQELFLEVLRDMADRGIITAGDDGFRMN